LLAPGSSAQAVAEEWAIVEYGELINARQLSHSGEPVGLLLNRLGGRPVPPPGQRQGDLTYHKLLEPLLEPYAYVLSDLLDGIETPPSYPLIELGGLWHPGEPQPAWVELLRSRHFIVESDGRGSLRVILPWQASGDPRQRPSATAAEESWKRSWPVLRHVMAAERKRLSMPGMSEGAEASPPPTLNVRVYPYVHLQARSTFVVGLQPHTVAVDSTLPTGDQPPLELNELQAFLDSGWTLEGARLDGEGGFLPLGSRREGGASFAGRKLTLAELAVAFRAIAYGGLAEPFMSLDRGYSPWQSLVTYAGRLQDTSLGEVSLYCDVRFKTFSMGLGIDEGVDLRDEMRRVAPSFKTHIEQFSADPASASVQAQQTRLWFYPDQVDLTVSPQGDLLAMRDVRMTAASERVNDESLTPTAGQQPPWTIKTVSSINRDYDALTEVFPELADLDQVVRLLSLFTWVEQARNSGLTVPDFDALLAVELPATPTPRTFPQMLAFNALPAVGTQSRVDAFDRVEVGDALERLNPRQGEVLDAQTRLRRALSALDRRLADEKRLIDSLAAVDLSKLTDGEIDMLAYRAQRLRMHRTVLATLQGGDAESLEQRRRSGETPRVFSLGIGGLDLGMDKALSRARSRSMGLVGAGSSLPTANPSRALLQQSASGALRVPAPIKQAWQRDPDGLPLATMPAHGLQSGLRSTFDGGWLVQKPGTSGSDANSADDSAQLFSVYSAESSEAGARRLFLGDDGRPVRFERLDRGRWLRYQFERSGQQLKVVLDRTAETVAPTPVTATELPSGLAQLRLDTAGLNSSASAALDLELRSATAGPLNATTPRWVLQRLVMGREADAANDPTLPGVAPLPPQLGEVEALMVVAHDRALRRPWEPRAEVIAGEQDPIRVAAAIDRWWDQPQLRGTVPDGAFVGVDPTLSGQRWSRAPKVGRDALLVLPEGAFAAGSEPLRQALTEAWQGRVSATADPSADENLVIIIGDESPGRFARRLREIAALPKMENKLLAGWSLAGPLRDDLAAWIVQESGVAGFGVASGSVLERRDATENLAAIAADLKRAKQARRVEAIPTPFLWFF
jgi:hypothetical protein